VTGNQKRCEKWEPQYQKSFTPQVSFSNRRVIGVSALVCKKFFLNIEVAQRVFLQLKSMLAEYAKTGQNPVFLETPKAA